MDTPVVLLIYRRPSLTRKLLESLSLVRPSQIFVVADGPKNSEESALVEETRACLEQIDWPCEIQKSFESKNLGLARRVSSGLDWVFSRVDRAIILEDDCLAVPSFFRFCEELLEGYASEEKVYSISGTNFRWAKESINSDKSYHFSRFHYCWGWATWKRAWSQFDFEMDGWSEFVESKEFKGFLKYPESVRFWSDTFRRVSNSEADSWAIRWVYTCWRNFAFQIQASKNLVSNIGAEADATHTKTKNHPLLFLPTEEMEFPLRNPTRMEADDDLDQYVASRIYKTSWASKVKSLFS